MTGKRIDLYVIVEDWLIPITLVEIFILVEVLIISLILKGLGVI